MDIGESAIDTVVIEAEFFMIEAEQVKCRGVEVVAVNGLLGGFEAEVVGAAIGGATLDAAAGHPGRESSGVVVAAFADALRGRLASKLAGADDKCAIEQAS